MAIMLCRQIGQNFRFDRTVVSIVRIDDAYSDHIVKVEKMLTVRRTSWIALVILWPWVLASNRFIAYPLSLYSTSILRVPI